MIKVLQFPLRSNRGGIAKYILENWRFINKNEYTFDFIAFQKNIDFQDRLLAEGCRVHYLSCLPRDDKYLFYREINKVFDDGYDVIHLHTSRWTGLELEEIAMERKVNRVIVHSHNIDIAVPHEDKERYDYFSKQHINIKKEFSQNWKRYSTSLCACSDLAARWLFGDELARSEVHILKNAIDTDTFMYNQETRDKYRRELGLEDNFVIGHTGRFDPQKNHKFILRVFKDILKALPTASLLLIGMGSCYNEIRNLAKEYGILSRIRFMGFRDDVAELMQAMDVFILPSLYEGLGIVLIEAQAAGLRCLASSAIPPEAKILLDTRFLPLEEDMWISALLEIGKNGYERNDGAISVSSAGYSMKESIKTIEKLYHGEYN